MTVNQKTIDYYLSLPYRMVITPDDEGYLPKSLAYKVVPENGRDDSFRLTGNKLVQN